MNETPYLGEEYTNQQIITVGATSILLSLAQNRSSFYMRNTSAGGQIISLSLSNKDDAVAGSGVVLNPNDTYAESNSEGFIAWRGKISAIANGAGATLTLIERN